jgi:hypothetical protein
VVAFSLDDPAMYGAASYILAHVLLVDTIAFNVLRR